ncbi:hypothetical protein KSP39_PZI016862 [Platanthera zijinensis]|uniref:DUF7392 domain-containing protein n=1 Tax=Platanthera zijinensis TaxID=2320716 RepID=A0AAP0B758_9ASPA
MPCFVPFNSSLDLTFFVLRSVNVLDDEIIHAMKLFSVQAEDLGCVSSSVMKSIHGNLVVWYGAWMKRSEENRCMLRTALSHFRHLICADRADGTTRPRILLVWRGRGPTVGIRPATKIAQIMLWERPDEIRPTRRPRQKRQKSPPLLKHSFSRQLSAMENLSHLGILIEHGFYGVRAGESKDGGANARFSSGDTVLLSGMIPASADTDDLLHACMAILRSSFKDIKGSRAGVCLECRDRPMVAILHVWESLQACYSWLIAADYRNNIRPYITSFSNDAQFDIFKVVYVSSDDGLNFQIPCSKAAVGSAAVN